MPSIVQIIAWLGMGILLTAYFLRPKLGPIKHALMNITASALIAPVCFVQEAWPVFALQIVWGCIALRDLYFGLRDRRTGSKSDEG